MNKLIFAVLCGIILSPESAAGQPRQNPTFARSTASSLLAALRTIDHGGTIESKYDGFSHETVVRLKKMRVSCGSKLKHTCVNIGASLHAPGVQLDYVRYVRLQVIFESKNWDRRHALDERVLVVVADGKTINLGKMGLLVAQGVDSNRLIDVMNEVLEVSLTYQTFKEIALAQIVEMKVGNTSFELTDKNVAALRDLNNRVKF
jgi:hypothetical protein